MDIAIAKRNAFRVANYVTWMRQKQMMQNAPKVVVATPAPVTKEPVVEKVPEPVASVEVPQEPVIEPTTPAVEEPVAPVEESAPATEPVEEEKKLTPDEVKNMTDEEVIAEWCKPVAEINRSVIELEILRRSRKHSRKIKVDLPGGKCTDDNVANFIAVLEQK